jgi:O-acetyl-ADP-ribose deacetylase
MSSITISATLPSVPGGSLQVRDIEPQVAFPGRTGWLGGYADVVAPRITLERGDITEQHVDAVVNAANSSLLGGGGVDGAIHRKGGPAILEACKEVRRSRFPDGLPTGQAVATTAGELPARWVIHTVGPMYDRVDDPARLLASCHEEALRVADELGAKTVAFPAISTGVFGYPVEEAASVATNAVRGARTSVDEVRFVLFGDDAYDAFQRALAE